MIKSRAPVLALGFTLRILFASPLFPPDSHGGAEAVALNLALATAARGHASWVLTTGAGRGGLRRETRFGLPVLVAGHHNLYWQGDRAPRSIPAKLLWHAFDSFNPAFAGVLDAALAASDPDVVVVHQFSGFSPALWERAATARIPVVQVLHDHHLVCVHSDLLRRSHRRCAAPPWPCRMRMAWLAALARGRVTAVAAPSRDILDRHRAFGFFEDLPHAVIPNGMEDLAGPGGPPPLVPEDGKTVAILGALERNKGIVRFAEDFAGSPLPAAGWRLRIAGSGSQEADLRRLASGRPSLEVLGFLERDAKAAFLRRAAVLAMPSRCIESFGTVLVEAMSMGRPVVASSVSGGPSEIVEEGVTGYLRDFDDGPSVFEALASLAGGTERWRSFSAAARARYEHDFTLEAFADRWEAFLGGR